VSRFFPPAGWAVGLSLVGAAALGIVAPAAADRPVQLTLKENPGYARITAKWGDGDETAPKVSAQVSNQVLILTFDEKVTIDLKKLKDSLPNWAAVTFMDPDGMTARIGLKQIPRLAVSTSADLVAVDLIPESVKETPPKIVSPLIAKRAAETEAKRVAALPPPVAMQDLEVRGSHAGDSSRIAFYWDTKVGYKVVSQGEGTLTLLFAKRAKPDLAYLRITPPANLADFKGENSDKGYTVTITSKDKLPIKHFLEDNVLVVDISRPVAPAAPAAKPQTMAAAPPPAKPPADTPILLAPPKVQNNTPAAATAAVPVASNVIGGPERATVMAKSWTNPAPANGIVTVRAAPITGGVELTVPFAAPAPAAVFARGNVVWAVFGASADLRLDQTQFPAGYRARAIRQKDAAILRIETPKGLSVSAEADEGVWTIKLAATANRPQRFLKPERKPDDSGRARIETMLIGAAGLVWFEDPVIGDQIAAAIAYAPSSSSPSPRDFVEASLPATAHGLAIAPKSDSVLVTLEGERVAVSMGSAAQSMPDTAIADTGFGAAATNPAFIDFATWGAARGEQYFDQLQHMQAAIVAVDPATPQGASATLDLVRFYIGHQQPQEALGLLRMAVNDRPELEQDPTVVGMRGAANFMAGRLKEAERDLSRGVLRGDPSAALWRAVVAAGLGEWERSIELFRESDKQIQLYPSARAAEFSVIWAEAALQVNDFDAARRQANLAVSGGERETKERGQLALANLRAVLDGPGPAYTEFEKLSQSAVAPVAVRAELRRLELAVPAGKMTAAEAAQELESLRFRWRGDEVEMATVGILADQYMRVGRFRDALLLAQSTALRDADAPGARDLRIKLSDYFRRLYLNGEADRLDPIQAVALFYEFDDTLMPIGPDGDQMVRKLAQRLVAFDLLEPASALLQYQVDNRIRGTAKSAVAVDLATIYLWDKRPDKALAAINSTRQPQLPKELALERRLLEAAAYRDMGRFDHVIELVEPLAGVEAKSLLADAYWRDRRWPQAAAAMIAMLPPPGQVQKTHADLVFKTAIAARMSKDAAVIAQVRAYGKAMEGNANKASFDLIVAQSDVSGASVSEAVRRLADAPRVDAFAAAMKQRFEAPKAVAQTAAPATAG
jgi:tetratricopeptide (TPR) repeat protein